MDKLLPCPFCGTDEQGPTKLVNVTLGHVAMVECRKCGTLTRASTWNTRHTPEGWQLVPVELTSEMGSYMEYPSQQWRSILAAAPKWGGE